MAKRIFIGASGSRGDIEPMIALSKALSKAGYDVLLGAPPDFAAWIASHGVAHLSIGEPARRFVDELAGAIAANTFLRNLADPKYERAFRLQYEDLFRGSEGADLLIFSTMLSGMTCLAEARKIPAMGALLAPMLPTADFAPPMQSRFSYGGYLNRLSHKGVNLALYTLFRPWWNRMRRDMLGLKPSGRLHNFRSVNGKPAPLLFAFSEALIPRPRDWPDYAVVTGNWLLDDAENWAPPPDLAEFLEAGPPPLYIGFGSMPLGRASAKAGVLKDALRLSGRRAILARGWGAWDEHAFSTLGGQVHAIDAAPHRKLFPLVAGVVCHGGAGTTAASLRAGRPALVTPLMLDQFFFANLVTRHGAGPAPLPVATWRVDRLAARLKDLADTPRYASRARDISARMAKEDGLGRALDAVSGVIGPP
ncbi:MAG: glycosyltransferase [Rhodomicrobium sp.]